MRNAIETVRRTTSVNEQRRDELHGIGDRRANGLFGSFARLGEGIIARVEEFTILWCAGGTRASIMVQS